MERDARKKRIFIERDPVDFFIFSFMGHNGLILNNISRSIMLLKFDGPANVVRFINSSKKVK